ncbi:immediate early response protein (IER) domain-containing protein [Ditylenchus destructor]|uniref:Immediate early response protein (IER) domain-containing protein n=1 Tax=Ditylenchus destructor TaxID=166010 RepID=A0AAD4NFM2_9BILA|nr:immediate early response protein (IER) domain-containing protein [Ditylenchus destructor]
MTTVDASPRPVFQSQPRNCFEEHLLERELEAEICQRFVRLSCEKMIASRNSRGGARLHRNLLILHLLRKARHSTKMAIKHKWGTLRLRTDYLCECKLEAKKEEEMPARITTTTIMVLVGMCM